MRKQTTAFLALLILAACGQGNNEAAQTPAATPAPAAEDLIRSRNASHWVVRDGTFENDTFTLRTSGLAFVQNAREAVTTGDAYTGEVVIAANNAANVVVRISNGCGTALNDQGQVTYQVQPGENTLRVHHTFARPAECARLSLTSQAPLTYRLTSARLMRVAASS
ncbi:MAG: hypothetical protein KJZ75_06345 [Hyphomonadaceae bacterium]|nr:hypothetical protein [Hyphomonadaceae bacterium]GIK47440.1 MAG: hypothetical protein BroJett013_01370 [Alphaproteobacteria bacterium]